MFVPKYLVNCNAYQPSFQFPLCFSYEDVIEKDDISRTVKEVVEEVNIFKYIDFSQNNAHGYDAIQMFEAVILAFAINGYASLRDLEKLCKYDIRFKFIMDGSWYLGSSDKIKASCKRTEYSLIKVVLTDCPLAQIPAYCLKGFSPFSSSSVISSSVKSSKSLDTRGISRIK